MVPTLLISPTFHPALRSGHSTGKGLRFKKTVLQDVTLIFTMPLTLPALLDRAFVPKEGGSVV